LTSVNGVTFNSERANEKGDVISGKINSPACTETTSYKKRQTRAEFARLKV
jgi:hypothetical protein